MQHAQYISQFHKLRLCFKFWSLLSPVPDSLHLLEESSNADFFFSAPTKFSLSWKQANFLREIKHIPFRLMIACRTSQSPSFTRFTADTTEPVAPTQHTMSSVFVKLKQWLQLGIRSRVFYSADQNVALCKLKDVMHCFSLLHSFGWDAPLILV